MVRPGPAGGTDPLLGRPFALYDVVRDGSDEPVGIDLVYLVVGRGTAALAGRRSGDRLAVWGPLGNGFGPPPDGPAVFVAGGIGQTPFPALGRWWLGAASYGGETVERPATSCTLLYGARTAALLAGLPDFEAAGIAVEVATDDGSAGRLGYATDLLADRLSRGDRRLSLVGAGRRPCSGRLARVGGGAGDSLRRLAREPHGLRLRRLLQLRHADPPGRGHVRPAPGLRRGADLRGGGCRLVKDGEDQPPMTPIYADGEKA